MYAGNIHDSTQIENQFGYRRKSYTVDAVTRKVFNKTFVNFQ